MSDTASNKDSGGKSKKRKVTVPWLVRMKQKGLRIAALTAYDFTFAAIEDSAGLDVILVGDSAGMVIAGNKDTLPVTLDEMVFMTRNVRRGVKTALLVADMPFGSFQVTPEKTIEAALRLMKEGGAEAVKLEGGKPMLETIQRLTDVGVPVMGHLGLTPQSVHAFGGFKLQGATDASAKRILDDAKALEDAGVFAIVLEKIPMELAAEVTRALTIPTIGIASGPQCDGQILVAHDMLGLDAQYMNLRFVRRYLEGAELVRDAVGRYVDDIKKGDFPNEDESWHS